MEARLGRIAEQHAVAVRTIESDRQLRSEALVAGDQGDQAGGRLSGPVAVHGGLPAQLRSDQETRIPAIPPACTGRKSESTGRMPCFDKLNGRIFAMGLKYPITLRDK